MKKTKLSRRTFLKALVALGVTVPSMTRLPRLQAQSDKIIVIGAGASGLAVAYMLMDEGFDVTILEARNRVGGRTLSDYDLAPYPIELGAEFIHGSEVVTWDLLEEFELDSLDQSDYETYIHIDGELLTGDEFNEAYDVDVESFTNQLGEEWLEDGNDDISLQGLLEESLDDDEYDENEELIKLLDSLSATDNGGNIDVIGVEGIATSGSSDAGTGDYRLEEGYSELMDAIAEELDDIRLNTPVKQIQWTANGVSITTDNGDVFEADKLVITLPLGVLKSGQVTFSPPLPQAKQDAINDLGAGHVDKLILKFDEAFWQDDMEILVTTLGTQSWWRPGIGRDDELPILTTLIGGRDALRFEAMSEADVIAENLNQLEQIFDVEDLASHLVEAKFISWGTDPYALMGYSYVPVDGVGLNEVLGEAVDDVLYFAGEATHSTHFGTVHGALESGLTAAQEIIDSLED